MMGGMNHRALRTALGIALIVLATACTKEPSGQATAPGQADNPPASVAIPAVVPADTSGGTGDVPAAPAGQGAAALATVLRPWKGDLDGMIQRRVIRVLTTYSKTGYFVDKGTQRGLVYESFRLFEDDLNKKLENKHIRVQRAPP
jgi:hypothetical protein